MSDKIEMVVINKDTVIKKRFEILDKDDIISFNLSNFTLAVKKDDLKRFI